MFDRLRHILTAPETKSSRTAKLLAFENGGRARWTPRDYAGLAREGYLANAIVHRCVRLIAENAASCTYLVFEGAQEREVHPLSQLLMRPNPRQDGGAFFEMLVSHMLLAGNAYIEAVALDGSVRELYALRPDRMKVVPGIDGWAEAYEYSVGGRNVRFDQLASQVPPILHLTFFHPLDGHYGLAPIEAAAVAVDAAIQIAVLDLSLMAPPSSPADGERHVVASGATGAWAGQANAIATWQDGAWAFLAPHTGWCIWSVADDAMFVFDGTQWHDLRSLGLDNVAHIGVNTTASSPNLLSVKSNAALLSAINAADGGSGDARLQISKESSAKTASVFFSDAFSGRAEFGLVGSDAFKLKVSADGSAWADALSIDQTSGNIALPRGVTLSGVIAPPQITANQNDYNPTGVASAAVMQLSSDIARNLSGLAGGADGRIISIINVGTQPIALVNESASSTAANRFTVGADLTLVAKQAAILRYDGTTSRWQAISGAMGLLAAVNNLPDVASKPTARVNLGVRDVLSANRTYYVRTDGSDSNNGLANTSAGAFLTIQKAIDTVATIDLAAYSATIQVGNGTYGGLISGKSYVGAGPVTIVGDETTPANVAISSSTAGAAIFLFDAVVGKYVLKGFKLISSASPQHGLRVMNNSAVDLQNLDFGALSNGWHMNVAVGGLINFIGNYTISGGAAYHYGATYAGVIAGQSVTVTLTGTPAFSAAFAMATAGVIKAPGVTYSGGATGPRYTAVSNGVIVTGGDASYLPGDSAGSTATGGQYS